MQDVQQSDSDPHHLLRFWFGEDGRAQPRLWFSGTPEIDAEVAARFAALYADAAAGRLDGWLDGPEGAVALMIALDQLPRHLFRGDARMFATDEPARAAARVALAAEEGLTPAQRAMAYLCLTHAEDREIVADAARRFEALARDPAARADRDAYKRMLRAARKHLRVLERFGRYPHRNELLARETTAEEAEYLAGESSRFARSVLPHPPKEGRLRILVLHSFRQSGRKLASRMRKLEQRLADIAELIYADAPHGYEPDAAERAMLEEDFGAVPDDSRQRCWWNADAEHRVYAGWEESLRMLEGLLPADGVLGFSQGGAVAGLLAAIHARKLRFAICISGFPSRAEAHQALLSPGGIDLPSLHVYGEQDALMDRDRTLALAACFAEPEVLSHPGGHFFPELWPVEAIRDFLLRFREAPPPERPAQEWPEEMTFEEVAARVSADPDPAGLLAQARGLRRKPEYGSAADIRAPQPGDVAHRIWLATWQIAPDAAREALAAEDDWPGLVRLAVRAVVEVPEPDELIAAVAERFAAQIAADEAAGRPSRAAEAAPRTASAADEATGLGRRIAALLRPDLPRPVVYIDYRRRVTALSQLSRAARRRAQGKRPKTSSPTPEISREVSRPRPVPVVPCPPEELSPLLGYLRSGESPLSTLRFPRGAVTPDGRLDLCKQVVGPAGIGPLLAALGGNEHVDRLLLGNNVVGPGGAREIADFIRSGRSRVGVWYIAGNEIDGGSLAPICQALAADESARGLWLKRNPVGPAGAGPLAELLRSDAQIETLDLVNTGLLDEGALAILTALEANRHLRHLYLGTDGLTPASAEAIGRYLAEIDRLESLYVDCNRLGDEGAIAIAAGLARSRRLRRLGLASNRIGPAGAAALAAALAESSGLIALNLGWTRATRAVGEDGNRIGDAGCLALAEMLRTNTTLRALDVSHNQVTQVGLNHLRDALEVNRSLVFLRHPQRGKATNPDSVAQLRGRIARNRRAAGLDEAEVEALYTPRPARDVLSVYRTAPME